VTPIDRLRMGLSSVQSPNDDDYLQAYDTIPQFMPSYEEKDRFYHDSLAEKYKKEFARKP
jgi:hypothetical protein